MNVTRPKRSKANLSKKVKSQGKAIKALQRRMRNLSKKLDVKPVDAIGFHFEPVADDEGE